jgi:hypothetical protein
VPFIVRKVLEWAKVIVGSLTSLIPGAEFISEGLDAIGGCLKSRQSQSAG